MPLVPSEDTTCFLCECQPDLVDKLVRNYTGRQTTWPETISLLMLPAKLPDVKEGHTDSLLQKLSYVGVGKRQKALNLASGTEF